MRAGQIGVVHHSTGFVGWCIEKLTHSDSHHTILAVSETECVSADYHGIVIEPISTHRFVVWSQYDLTNQERWLVTEVARTYVGGKYNYMAFVLLGLTRPFNLQIPRSWAHWVNSRGKVTCSQLCRDSLGALAIQPIPSEPIVAPSDFQFLFEDMGWWNLSTPDLDSSVPMKETA